MSDNTGKLKDFYVKVIHLTSLYSFYGEKEHDEQLCQCLFVKYDPTIENDFYLQLDSQTPQYGKVFSLHRLMDVES
jgi:hypothetical protein